MSIALPKTLMGRRLSQLAKIAGTLSLNDIWRIATTHFPIKAPTLVAKELFQKALPRLI